MNCLSCLTLKNISQRIISKLRPTKIIIINDQTEASKKLRGGAHSSHVSVSSLPTCFCVSSVPTCLFILSLHSPHVSVSLQSPHVSLFSLFILHMSLCLFSPHMSLYSLSSFSTCLCVSSVPHVSSFPTCLSVSSFPTCLSLFLQSPHVSVFLFPASLSLSLLIPHLSLSVCLFILQPKSTKTGMITGPLYRAGFTGCPQCHTRTSMRSVLSGHRTSPLSVGASNKALMSALCITIDCCTNPPPVLEAKSYTL